MDSVLCLPRLGGTFASFVLRSWTFIAACHSSMRPAGKRGIHMHIYIQRGEHLKWLFAWAPTKSKYKGHPPTRAIIFLLLPMEF